MDWPGLNNYNIFSVTIALQAILDIPDLSDCWAKIGIGEEAETCPARNCSQLSRLDSIEAESSELGVSRINMATIFIVETFHADTGDFLALTR